MYLCDSDLHALLPELTFVHEDGASPFDPNKQIQPSSIDLRLSFVFWHPLRRFTIDLRRAHLLEIQPRRYYKQRRLTHGETIILKPMELLLSRTLESFHIPNGYAAELTGRSSFARLGLMVNATGGYINPGWRGRMPLQLVNFGPNSIRLTPGLPICQVRLVRLSGLAERPYGHPSLSSVYLDDDGGPSYWWRDKRIKALHAELAERAVEERIQRTIETALGQCEPEVIERLDKRIRRMSLEELQNADALLDIFAHAEERRRTWRRWSIRVSRAVFTVAITASLWVANKPSIRWWHYAVWVCALCLFALSMYAFRTEVGEHFGDQELKASRATRDAV